MRCAAVAGRPIASLAFNESGDVLAVASGHKLHMWEYTKPAPSTIQPDSPTGPSVALKTRRWGPQCCAKHLLSSRCMSLAVLSSVQPQACPPAAFYGACVLPCLSILSSVSVL